jgi:hypothetical protein
MVSPRPIWLPLPGSVIYRPLRQLLRAARKLAERGSIRLAIVAPWGKSDVEVRLRVISGGRTVVLATSFPLYVEAELAKGFPKVAFEQRLAKSPVRGRADGARQDLGDLRGAAHVRR